MENDPLAASHRGYLNRSPGYPRAATMGSDMKEENNTDVQRLTAEIARLRQGIKDYLDGKAGIYSSKAYAHFSKLLEG